MVVGKKNSITLRIWNKRSSLEMGEDKRKKRGRLLIFLDINLLATIPPTFSFVHSHFLSWFCACENYSTGIPRNWENSVKLGWKLLGYALNFLLHCQQTTFAFSLLSLSHSFNATLNFYTSPNENCDYIAKFRPWIQGRVFPRENHFFH